MNPPTSNPVGLLVWHDPKLEPPLGLLGAANVLAAPKNGDVGSYSASLIRRRPDLFHYWALMPEAPNGQSMTTSSTTPERIEFELKRGAQQEKLLEPPGR